MRQCKRKYVAWFSICVLCNTVFYGLLLIRVILEQESGSNLDKKIHHEMRRNIRELNTISIESLDIVKTTKSTIKQTTNKGSRIPYHLQKNGFQKVQKDDIYIYSAYFDRRQNQLIILGVGRPSVPGSCLMWYKHKDSVRRTATPKTLGESHRFRYSGYALSCDINHLDVPDYVSYLPLTSSVNDISVLLPVTEIKQIEKEAHTTNFTVCVSPLYGNLSPNRLVEFIEINRLFGANNFIFYNMSLSQTASPYLDYYKKQGVVSVYPWNFPLEIKSAIHYNGQLAVINDCLYKSVHKTKLLLIVDLDEIVVPYSSSSWDKLLKMGKDSTALVIKNVFFKTEWPKDPTFANNSLVKKYSITSLLNTYRERKIWPHGSRSKYFVRPDKAFQVSIHTAKRYSGNVERVSPSVAMLFHYRNWEQPDKPLEVTDKRMHQFAENIIARIHKVHKEMMK